MLFLVVLVSLVVGQCVLGGPCPAGVPPGCRCLVDSHRVVRSVNCTGAGLTAFPLLPKSVRSLDLSHNDIKVLRRNLADNENFADLLTLNIQESNVEEVDVGFFEQFPSVTNINLRNNKLTRVPSTNSSSDLYLVLSENRIKDINNFNGTRINALYLDNNKINVIKEYDLNQLQQLKFLSLKKNNISTVHPDSLSSSITHLLLGENKLSEVPVLNQLKHTLLSLAAEYNVITSLDNILFYTNIQNCTLVANKIQRFPHNSTDTSSLNVLYLTKNNIDQICREDLAKFPKLTILDLSENCIEYIPDKCFSPLKQLQTLEMSYNDIQEMAYTALKNLNQLKECNLRRNRMKLFAPNLKSLPNLRSLDLTANALTEFPHVPEPLYLLYLSENKITHLNSRQVQDASSLIELDLSYNKIEHVQEGVLSALHKLQKLYLEGNKISSLENMDMSLNTRLNHLDLGANHIPHIPDNFFDNTVIDTLVINHNDIKIISNKTLPGLDGFLKTLDVSFNDLEELSHVGLSAVESLNLDGNKRLLSKLPRTGLHKLRHVQVPYPVMCCWFRKIKKKSVEDVTDTDQLTEIAGYWDENQPHDSKATLLTPDIPRGSEPPTLEPTGTPARQPLTYQNFGISGPGGVLYVTSGSTFPTSGFTSTQTLPTTAPGRGKREVDTVTATMYTSSIHVNPEEQINFEDLAAEAENVTFKTIVSVQDTELDCKPVPDEFNPCEDLIGNWVLRLGVWCVCSLALVGNATLFFVTLLSTKKFTPTRFLILNLSFSDLFTGIYLTMLAVVDATAYGVYEDYAMSWQNGPGCKIAGFMVTFSSELSVITLTVISVERMVTIIHYSNPYKHLKTRHIALAMVVGWIISVTAGTLPLLGVSDYSLVAICLPFQREDSTDFGLIMTLMAVNTIAVSVIIYCYLTIFCNVRHLQKPLDNADFRETLRMALIVLTDVICWVPIVICGVSAAFGHSLITTSNAKILVVFFLPLNACANPFLYSISRPGFKKDVLYILNKVGLCQQAYYISSRRKSGMDLELRKKLKEMSRKQDLQDLRKQSQDSTSSTSSSGYSSDTSIIKQQLQALVSLAE